MDPKQILEIKRQSHTYGEPLPDEEVFTITKEYLEKLQKEGSTRIQYGPPRTVIQPITIYNNLFPPRSKAKYLSGYNGIYLDKGTTPCVQCNNCGGYFDNGKCYMNILREHAKTCVQLSKPQQASDIAGPEGLAAADPKVAPLSIQKGLDGVVAASESTQESLDQNPGTISPISPDNDHSKI